MTVSRLLVGAGITALLIPPLVFCIAGLGEGMEIEQVATACVEQFFTARQNLGVAAGLGLFPVLLTGLLIWIGRRVGWHWARDNNVSVAALTPVLLVLTWANFEFWPIFLPGRDYPGFPHGLELVLGPLFYAPAAMLIGLIAGAILLPEQRRR
jgi:hypothetical protein